MGQDDGDVARGVAERRAEPDEERPAARALDPEGQEPPRAGEADPDEQDPREVGNEPGRRAEHRADRAELPVAVGMPRWIDRDRERPRRGRQQRGREERHRPSDPDHLEGRAEQEVREAVGQRAPSTQTSVVGEVLLAEVVQGDRVDRRAGRAHRRTHRHRDRRDPPGVLANDEQHERQRRARDGPELEHAPATERDVRDVSPHRRAHDARDRHRRQHEPDPIGREPPIVEEQREEREERRRDDTEDEEQPLDRARRGNVADVRTLAHRQPEARGAGAGHARSVPITCANARR